MIRRNKGSAIFCRTPFCNWSSGDMSISCGAQILLSVREVRLCRLKASQAEGTLFRVIYVSSSGRCLYGSCDLVRRL
uniref:Uncharacterized protein n=1 Tax=Aegilops tauschii subsp. strangulata TaxID=200361 RepID=A0A453FAC3_AEGTS